MAEITVNPRVLKSISVLIASTEYADAIASFQFVPAQTVMTWKGGKPDATFTDVTDPTWTCNIKLAQDWDTAGSLANYLIAHAGEQTPVTFIPTGGATVSGTLILAVPPIGGDINAWLEGTISCGVVGAPTITPAG